MSVPYKVPTTWNAHATVAMLGLLGALTFAGCHRNPAQGSANGTDPADANFASPNAATPAPAGSPASPQAAPVSRVLAQSSGNGAQQQAEDYSPQPGYGPQQPAPNQGYGAPGYSPSAGDAEADAYAADLTAEAATEPPPPLPDYEQPPAPAPDYMWTPGYWAWGPSGYYWVPGAWVAAPYTGALWTPGYWAFVDGAYRFHHGFWGPHIGFYGGIDYGFGYTGYGYYGGYWRDNHFFYNTAVNRVNVNAVRNVYVRNVVVNNVVVNNRILNRVSYNGGRGGIQASPHPAELAVLHEQRIPPMQSQLAIRHEAEGNRAQSFSENHGRPQITAAARPVTADRTFPSALPRASAGASTANGGNRQGAPRQNGNSAAKEGAAPGSSGLRGGQNGRANQADNRTPAPGQHPESPRAVEPQRVVPPVRPGVVQQLPGGQASHEARRSNGQQQASPRGNNVQSNPNNSPEDTARSQQRPVEQPQPRQQQHAQPQQHAEPQQHSQPQQKAAPASQNRANAQPRTQERNADRDPH